MPVLARPVAPSRLLVAAVTGLLALGAWWGAAAPAQARTFEVSATPDVYDPASLTVRVGDTVVWTFEASGGSVTADEGAFDSHPECPEESPFGCAIEGETFEVTFTTAGTVAYHAKGEFAGAEGQVVVEPAPPRPTPSPSETTPSPSESTPTETESSEPEPSPEPSTSEPAPQPTTSSPEPPPPPPPPPTETATPVDVSSPSPTPSPTPEAPSATTEDSPVPVPAPSFEDFPEARDPQRPEDDVEGTVAIDGPDGGGTGRTVWGLVGGASVLGTLGAFGRRVLFAEPWDG